MRLRPVVLVAVAVSAALPALAADPVGLEIEVAVDGAKAGSLTDVRLGVFDADGKLTGTCVSGSATELVSNSQTHWLTNKGKTTWRCTLDGSIDGQSALVLSSKTVDRVWLASAVGKNKATLLTVGGKEVGVLTANETGFDIDGEEPTWFDLDGEEPTWFDLDGEEPTWYGAKWLGSALSTIASQDHGGAEPDW